ncbi:hypothetical protein B0T25DRAFT_554650 [Lasiosphaeria hispida]|uniref:Uncharacterized protein n=1 Tax=Lasiosphaeria hispida TaxID=260671 RepID=A0AAJ0H860_9PEZI|nr:hypothetical protein B0T25DRAFT_554650 [Lasiosphaeria hispida]
MDAVDPPGTDLDDFISQVESLLGRLKRVRDSSRPSRTIRSNAQAPAHTGIGPSIHISSPPTPDPISETLTSIIKEATHLLRSYSAIIGQVRPLSAPAPTEENGSLSSPSFTPGSPLSSALSSTEQGSPSASTSSSAQAAPSSTEQGTIVH